MYARSSAQTDSREGCRACGGRANTVLPTLDESCKNVAIEHATKQCVYALLHQNYQFAENKGACSDRKRVEQRKSGDQCVRRRPHRDDEEARMDVAVRGKAIWPVRDKRAVAARGLQVREGRKAEEGKEG
eukprot:5951754-Pleurochrysis_carterae.AAC.1